MDNIMCVDTDSVFVDNTLLIKTKLNSMYGRGFKSAKSLYYNAMLEACYYDQVIDEACNADISFNNQFRKTLSIEDCVNFKQQSRELKMKAKEGLK